MNNDRGCVHGDTIFRAIAGETRMPSGPISTPILSAGNVTYPAQSTPIWRAAPRTPGAPRGGVILPAPDDRRRAAPDVALGQPRGQYADVGREAVSGAGRPDQGGAPRPTVAVAEALPPLPIAAVLADGTRSTRPSLPKCPRPDGGTALIQVALGITGCARCPGSDATSATNAAVRFLRQLLKGVAYVPRVAITDKLASYGAALRAVLPSIEHRRHKELNNRAENSYRRGACDDDLPSGVALTKVAMAVVEAQLMRRPGLAKWFVDIHGTALADRDA